MIILKTSESILFTCFYQWRCNEWLDIFVRCAEQIFSVLCKSKNRFAVIIL